MSIEAVVFDIGNVLLEWHPERHYDAAIGVARRKAVFAAVDLHGMNERIDLGENIADVVTQAAQAHPDFHDEIMLWHSDWAKMAAPDIPRSAVLLRALRAKGVAVFALSNFGVETFEIAKAAYPVLDEFDRAYISGRMQTIKPGAEIYARVEADCGIPPNRLLFTDDKAENVEAAAARDWQTHLFDGPERFAARLVSEGLLSKAEAQL